MKCQHLHCDSPLECTGAHWNDRIIKHQLVDVISTPNIDYTPTNAAKVVSYRIKHSTLNERTHTAHAIAQLAPNHRQIIIIRWFLKGKLTRDFCLHPFPIRIPFERSSQDDIGQSEIQLAALRPCFGSDAHQKRVSFTIIVYLCILYSICMLIVPIIR